MNNFFDCLSFNLIEVVITALVTLFIEHVAIEVIQILKKRLLKLRYELLCSRKTEIFVKQYYEKQQCYNNLYQCKIGERTKDILFLSDKQWYGLSVDVYNNENIILYQDRKKPEYRSSSMVVRTRKFMGQQLINNPALYFVEASTPTQIQVSSCDYFQRLTLVDRMETELLKNAYLWKKQTELRDKLIMNFEMAIKRKRYPVSIGCDVALVVNHNGAKKIAMQTRSFETSQYGGRVAVIPSFGLCPVVNSGIIESCNEHKLYKNLLLYNIIKEYCEEVFNKEELERCPDGHANPYWFYEDVSEARDLLKALEDKRASCIYLGFGFDAINGISNMAVLLYIEDGELSRKIVNTSISNWEYRRADDQRGIEFVDIESFILRERFDDELYQSETAFTLSLAIEEIKKLG